jgi:hypothetical protein
MEWDNLRLSHLHGQLGSPFLKSNLKVVTYLVKCWALDFEFDVAQAAINEIKNGVQQSPAVTFTQAIRESVFKVQFVSGDLYSKILGLRF